jgi:hypothetical protein
MIALKRNEARRAERSFRKAAQQEEKMAESYYGLGLAYQLMRHRKMDAIDAFKQALVLKDDYIDALYALGQIYLTLSLRRDGFGSVYNPRHSPLAQYALERRLSLAPDHPYANFDLARIHDEGMGDFRKAIFYYELQLINTPDEPEVVFHLARSYFKADWLNEELHWSQRFSSNYPEQAHHLKPIRVMLQAVEAYRHQDYVRGEQFFGAYLDLRSKEGRSLFDDISSITSETETNLYSTLTLEKQKRYRRQFWHNRDPDPTTSENERLLEHYYRVLFSQYHFGRYSAPRGSSG